MSSKPILKITIFFRILIYSFIVTSCSFNAFFCLKYHKDGAGIDKLIELLVFEFVDLSFEFCLLVPFLCLNSKTSLAQKMNHFVVCKGKSRHSYLHRCCFIESKVRQLLQTFFHLICHPSLEALHTRIEHSRWRLLRALLDPGLVLFIHKVCKEFIVKIKFDGVVASRDSLNIPLDTVELLNFFDVVHVAENHESDKNRKTANQESLFLPRDQ